MLNNVICKPQLQPKKKRTSKTKNSGLEIYSNNAIPDVCIKKWIVQGKNFTNWYLIHNIISEKHTANIYFRTMSSTHNIFMKQCYTILGNFAEIS